MQPRSSINCEIDRRLQNNLGTYYTLSTKNFSSNYTFSFLVTITCFPSGSPRRHKTSHKSCKTHIILVTWWVSPVSKIQDEENVPIMRSWGSSFTIFKSLSIWAGVKESREVPPPVRCKVGRVELVCLNSDPNTVLFLVFEFVFGFLTKFVVILWT